mgnify:CR=1 FL=1
MNNGECWFADITRFHEVENRSDSDRLQLMIDCELNPWWEEILRNKEIVLEELSAWDHHNLEALQARKENLLTMDVYPGEGVLHQLDQVIAARLSRLS